MGGVMSCVETLLPTYLPTPWSQALAIEILRVSHSQKCTSINCGILLTQFCTILLFM